MRALRDDLTEAVLARDEVARYLRGGPSQSELQARERINAYLDELRTTQRYAFYRALKHPLYPILRKIDRRVEGIEHVRRATEAGRVVYASNHKSHTDYLVEPLALEDSGIRPPLIAAGINLFGGPFGVLHRHVTGAIPIRRDTKDPAYLITLKAYVAELLRRHDLLFYLEGGRSYSGELKGPKTGLVHASLLADRSTLAMIPVAVAYDCVLEDHVLAKQGVKRRQRPFSMELAEMVRYAVGYQSRSFVTFGEPLAVTGWDPGSRRDVMDLAQLLRRRIGALYKVVPTAILAAAFRPSIARPDLVSRMESLLDGLRTRGANLAVDSAREALELGTASLIARGVLVVEHGRYRVRERAVLRYYARTIQHLLGPPPAPEQVE